ncbi:hypothetical protein M0813_23148 [Anaeramoeba flamelloides]|uniref:Uncharacterized protein n=1 Tax=Anaeramoeba flamelloides TaxID=1746091 RepID=A0ABQ8YA64_9EUKA|nr:hypothetical protein M0813_23148 [Anaeramoeba flamelloides]
MDIENIINLNHIKRKIKQLKENIKREETCSEEKFLLKQNISDLIYKTDILNQNTNIKKFNFENCKNRKRKEKEKEILTKIPNKKVHDLRNLFPDLSKLIVFRTHQYLLNKYACSTINFVIELKFSFSFYDIDSNEIKWVPSIYPNEKEVKLIQQKIYKKHTQLRSNIINEHLKNNTFTLDGTYVNNERGGNIIESLIEICSNKSQWFANISQNNINGTQEQKSFVIDSYIKFVKNHYVIKPFDLELIFEKDVPENYFLTYQDYQKIQNNYQIIFNKKKKKFKFQKTRTTVSQIKYKKKKKN